MVYSPPSNQHKQFPQSGAKPHVVTDEIDAGAIKLQPPKIRPISRSSSPKRTSADSWKRPAVIAVNSDESAVVNSEFRNATTASTVELIANSAIPITAPTVENLTHQVEVIRNVATLELNSNALDAVRNAVAETSNETNVSPITQWETPYNKPAIDTPENIQYTRLALQYLQQGRIEDAERLYKQALVVAERTFPVGNPAISRAVEDLATFYYGHEKYKQAEPFVSRLLKQRVETLACDDWLLIRTVDQLADVYEKCGEPIQAQVLYKLLLARQEEAVGQKSPVCAFTLSRLADSYLRQEHYSAAESLLQTILGIQETLHGRCSIEISTTLQELASIYQKLGRYDRAAEMLERLLHILESIHGDNGLSVASCLLKLADLLTEVEMVSEAEPLYRRAQEIYRLSYGERTAAHSVFKKKLERVTDTMINISRLSKDKPIEQEQCSRFPAVRVNLDDMLPSKLGTGQPSRCLGHAISADVIAENVVPFSAKNSIDVNAPTLELPLLGHEETLMNSDFETVDCEFAVTSALVVPMFESSESFAFADDDFDFIATFEPSFDFEKTTDMQAPPVPALDFAKTAELVAPSFDFSPSFEIDPPNFDAVKSKFESNGELDSILDPFFAKELATIYESTAANRALIEIDPDKVENVDQQDTILDLEPAKTLKLPRQSESVSGKKTTQLTSTPQSNDSKKTQILEAVPTSKPRRLASKTVSLPKLDANAPHLSLPVPGLVTVTATDIRAIEPAQSSMQQRDTVREKPVLFPEPFPSSRKKSATQTAFAVKHPGTKTRN